MSAYAARRMTAGQTWSGKYGWIAAADVARYDRGERNAHGNWITAEEDARWHANIKSGWRVETEHYVVTTNDSLESGVRLAARLERLNDVWQQLFLTYYTTEAELKKRFDGAARPTATAGRSASAGRIRSSTITIAINTTRPSARSSRASA